ncbi:hypothetical protein SmJEL517_g05128 [Synchytrium microbalum]|uniref:Cytochrome b5 heme-binding domain-containing protein n=1 Tax=Synchytrium microbalum TaxID=1806994 RepID=A0A507C276_9FUNG|nr:uncharacterized protein SmJEL517_g05128 [Synchytrium microbalum]TPX31603.1 hypothetical protein SmJEL517_g05128 [Synchytrium microbalum]
MATTRWLLLLLAFSKLLTTILAALCTTQPSTVLLSLPSSSLNLANYPLNVTLWIDSQFHYAIYWRAETAPCPDGLRVAIVLKSNSSGTLDTRAWAGLGFGDYMLDPTTMFMVMQRSGNGITLGEFKSTGAYQPPIPLSQALPNVASPFVSLSGGYDQAADGTQTIFAEFYRPAVVNDGYHTAIALNDSQRLIFAFQPQPTLDNNFFNFHYQYRGRISVSSYIGSAVGSVSSMSKVDETISWDFKELHGWGMLTAWFVILPFGIVYARYYRSSPGWLFVHLSVQSIGLLLIISCFVIMLLTIQLWNQPHARLGVSLITLIFIQASLGACKYYGMRSKKLIDLDWWIQLSHRVLGPLTLAGSCAQAYLGLQTLVPWSEPRGKSMWFYWFSLLGMWIIVFSTYEIWYLGQKNRGPKTWLTKIRRIKLCLPNRTKSMPLPSSESSLQTLTAEAVPAVVQIPVPAPNETLKTFTWESLDEAVLSGQLYVVANGIYVFDLNQWRFSHPGGQSILEQVAGTDISLDFWTSAGYDATEFIPRLDRIDPRAHRPLPAPPITSTTGSSNDQSPTMAEVANNPAALSSLTKKDWEKILSSRKTHIHTRLAINRLSQMIVGELSVSSPQQVMVPPSPYKAFSPYEFLRYSVTSIIRIVATAPASSSPKTDVGPVIIEDRDTWYRVRLARVYPFDRRDAEPKELIAGSRMQLQFIVPGSGEASQRVTRWLVPIKGDLTAFEVLIKVKKNETGPLASLVKSLKPGKKQFKIRGPFGTPLIHPTRPLNVALPDWIPDELIFIVAGSGILSFLQFVEYQVFKTGIPLKIHAPFVARNPDELDLNPSIHNTVTINQFMGDGWAWGSTSTEKNTRNGYFPVSHTLSPLRTRIKLLYGVHSVSDVAANPTLKLLGLSYPWLMESCIYVSAKSPMASTVYETEFGEIHPGSRLSEASLTRYLEQLKPGKRRVVIAGPEGFCNMVYGTCTRFGFTYSDIVLYSPNTIV